MKVKELVDLKEFPANSDYVIENLLCRLYEESFPNNNENGIIELNDNGTFKFVQNDESYDFTADNPEQDILLRNFFRRGFVNLACVVPMRDDGRKNLRLHVIFFSFLNNLGELSVILSESVIVQLIKKKLINDSAVDSELAGMPEKFYLQDIAGSSKKYFACASAIPKLSIVAKSEDDDESIKISKPVYSNEIFSKPPKKVIELFCKSFILSVGLYEDSQTGQALAVAQKITFSRKNFPCMQLARGELIFTTEKKYSSALVSELLQRKNSYVNLWKAYADKEGEFLIKKNRRIGLIGYESQINISTENDAAEIILTVKSGSLKSLDFLNKGDTLRTSEEVPPFIENPEITWQEYQAARSTGDYQRYEILKIDKNAGKLHLKPIGKTKLEERPHGHLFFDDTGDFSQIRRRQYARERIETSTSANPHLGLIIGGDDNANFQAGLLPSKVAKTKVRALTDFVSKKIFSRNPPTETQRRAIEIALNTPDIAIIQGPPGTGKTTVITAIIERLNELADKKILQRGQILITSLQHDAVENLQRRIRINSLPTVKFGTRRDDDEDLDTVVGEWCMELAKKIRAKNPVLQESEQLSKLTRTFNFYFANPSLENAAEFLNKAHSIVTEKNLLDEIESLQEELTDESANFHSEILNTIRKLRTTEKSFADGGAKIAESLLFQLETKLDTSDPENKKILDTLQQAADFFDATPSKNFLGQLKECKDILLKRCIPKPSYKKISPNPELIDLYKKIKIAQSRPSDGVGNALYNLLNELENNPEIIIDTVKNYSFVFAATAQQSESRKIKEFKGKVPEYDTVIVDEAARVNPGDLMIPLSQAKTKIIMVGDHRQLPHMYDEEIFECLNEEGTEITPLDIKESMFEHLVSRAKKMKENDNIDRFITLDAQYRMHPLLGNFVSENFYSKYNEQFKSPLGAEFFSQPFESQPFLWVNLPANRGKSARVGTSLIRECEADFIANRIKQYLEQMPDKKFSIGVISFYSAQCRIIANRLDKLGIGDKIKVGTVDAFQGMEFDVIFLSVVRTGIKISNEVLKNLDFADDTLKEKIGRANYGFLTSENRLCVALSRQKRLLVVVGDAELFSGLTGGRLSNFFVPALKNFYELCESRGALENA